MIEPLFLKPVLQEKIWGGTRLESEFGYTIPSQQTGECWAISAHPNGPSIVLNGPYQGKSLAELWTEAPALFGHPSQSVFPLLTKIIDANDDLSVQVHPDDAYALAHEGELGKTECWYILAAEPGAEIIYGHTAETREELVARIDAEDWETLLRRQTVEAGDFFYVPSGTIHALGKGIMVLETQQSSDTTYRLYDYDRLDKHGEKRPLHLQQAMEVTTVPFIPETSQRKNHFEGTAQIEQLVVSPFFSVYHALVTDQLILPPSDTYTLVSVIQGEGTLQVTPSEETASYPLAKGQHFILPFGIGPCHLSGHLSLIYSNPAE